MRSSVGACRLKGTALRNANIQVGEDAVVVARAVVVVVVAGFDVAEDVAHAVAEVGVQAKHVASGESAALGRRLSRLSREHGGRGEAVDEAGGDREEDAVAVACEEFEHGRCVDLGVHGSLGGRLEHA